ncbi:MAG: LysR family transcriptional regulator [Pseudomonadota bacterium]
MSDLNKFELFVRIADAGSITQVAKQLGVTKALVSRKLRQLEKDLQVDLFNRYKQRLQLTDTGKIILAQCQRLQRELATTRELCQSIHDEPEGVLHIVVLDFFARKVIYPKFENFLTRYPKLRIFIDTSERIPDFTKEQVDIAIGFTLPMPPDIIQRRLQNFRYIMAASPDYFDKYGHPNKLVDLINHKYIGHKARDEIRSINLRKNYHLKIVPYLVLNDVAAMIECAKQGLGIIQLPSYMLEKHIKTGLLEETLPTYQADNMQVYCYYPKFRYVQPKVRKFLDFIFSSM